MKLFFFCLLLTTKTKKLLWKKEILIVNKQQLRRLKKLVINLKQKFQKRFFFLLFSFKNIFKKLTSTESFINLLSQSFSTWKTKQSMADMTYGSCCCWLVSPRNRSSIKPKNLIYPEKSQLNFLSNSWKALKFSLL